MSCANQGSNPSGHQIGLDPAGLGWAGEAVRFRLLRASFAGTAQAQIAGRHAVLDVARGHLAASVRSWGGHLVAWNHGHRDDRRRAAVLQRATAAGDAPNPGHAAAKVEELAQGVEPAAELPRPHACAGSRTAGYRCGTARASVPASSGAAVAAGSVDARREAQQLLRGEHDHFDLCT